MDMVRQEARYDWLVELSGASALGLGAGYAALKLAPSFAVAAPAAMTGAGLSFFALGMLVMRAAPAGRRSFAVPDFTVAAVGDGELLLTDAIDELLLDTPVQLDELMLDQPIEQPLLLDAPAEDVLLLEDVVSGPEPQARVVRLFAQPSTPIPQDDARSDAAKELYEALNKLRRSLR